MLRGLENSVLGVWVAHGEGRFRCQNDEMDNTAEVIALQYMTTDGTTQQYPDNPNGSDLALAGISSSDGRHLAMMPHPERTILKWQAPWISPELSRELQDQTEYPWQQMFHNSYNWCLE